MNLTGKRILITRPRAQAEEFARLLIAEGAEPIFFPVIEIRPLNDFTVLDSALHKLDEYGWLILTSIHAVDVVFKRLEILGIHRIPPRVRVAAIGSKTAFCLTEHGVTPDFVPNDYVAEAIPSGLGDNIFGKRFLLPQSDLARVFLANAIRTSGGIVNEVTAYHTRTTCPDSHIVDSLYSGVDVVTFASPSSVKGFMNVFSEHGVDLSGLPGNPLIACIGPVTASAARNVGLPVHLEAKEHTMNGLFSALKEI